MIREKAKAHAWCERCEAETDFIKIEDLARLFPKLKKITQTENLHKLQISEGGEVLICLESVLKNQT